MNSCQESDVKIHILLQMKMNSILKKFKKHLILKLYSSGRILYNKKLDTSEFPPVPRIFYILSKIYRDYDVILMILTFKNIKINISEIEIAN